MRERDDVKIRKSANEIYIWIQIMLARRWKWDSPRAEIWKWDFIFASVTLYRTISLVKCADHEREWKSISENKVHRFALIKMESHLKFNYSITAQRWVSTVRSLKAKKKISLLQMRTANAEFKAKKKYHSSSVSIESTLIYLESCSVFKSSLP